tara:strand:+ start:1777 stop:1965 length:189 start_codon:yes stop_codon:yes gene_type:complete
VPLNYKEWYSNYTNGHWNRMYWEFKEETITNKDIYKSVEKNYKEIQRILKHLGLENTLDEEE